MKKISHNFFFQRFFGFFEVSTRGDLVDFFRVSTSGVLEENYFRQFFAKKILFLPRLFFTPTFFLSSLFFTPNFFYPQFFYHHFFYPHFFFTPIFFTPNFKKVGTVEIFPIFSGKISTFSIQSENWHTSRPG